MIVLFLRDGLGNQMFQYAFVRALQIQTKQELYISLRSFKYEKANRNYSLDKLNINEDVKIFSKKKEEVAYIIHRLLNELRRFRGDDFSKAYIGTHIIDTQCDEVYCFADCSNKKFAKNITVRGYFQNYKNFENCDDIIRKELKVKTEPTKDNKEMLKKITSSNSVCVHIRRGDYLNPQWSGLNICNYDYYRKAMDKINEKVENPVFYIFSNTSEDIAWIKENYDFSDCNVEYVDLNNPDYEELRLMYSCKHFIISNSTFSWWAQYLGEYENKVVVAPSEWNRDLVDSTGIYMPRWEVIKIEEGK